MTFQDIRAYSTGLLKASFQNKTTLDKLSTSDEGNLLFDGKEINSNSVEWNQIQTEGVKIAEVTIDGIATEIFVPNGEYSTEEKVVGKWIDGKPIYERVINVENFIIGYNEITLENLDTIINYSGSLIFTDYPGYKRFFPYVQNNSTAKVVINHYNETKFVVASAFDCNNIYIIIQYTKITDY